MKQKSSGTNKERRSVRRTGKTASCIALSLCLFLTAVLTGCGKKEISDIRYFFISQSNGMAMYYEAFELKYENGEYIAHIEEDHGMIDDDEVVDRTVKTDGVFAAALAGILNKNKAADWDGYGEKRGGLKGYLQSLIGASVTDSTDYSFSCETKDGKNYSFSSYHNRPDGFGNTMEEVKKLFETLLDKEEYSPESETPTSSGEEIETADETPEASEPDTEPAEVSESETEQAEPSEPDTEPAPPETPESSATEAEPLHFTKDEYPKVDGATAMYPMSVEIAKAVIGMSDEEAEDFIVHNTTAQAYYNLIDGTCDLIFVSEPSDDILKRAEEAGVHFEMVGIGRDGFVFVINRENPVDSLTLDEIRGIYTGKIKNWSEVGGEDREIIAYQREANSGSQNLMEKMVMKGEEMAEAPAEFVIESMSGLIDSVASFENSRSALGYSIYLYAKDQYVKDSIKFLSIDGVYPTDESIADGTYPLSKIVYAIFRDSEPENSNVRKLVEWLRTPEGQKPVEAGGYVGMK